MSQWWSNLEACWIGIFLAAAAGFLAGYLWYSARMRAQFLVLALQLEAKKDEAQQLRDQLSRLRLRISQRNARA